MAAPPALIRQADIKRAVQALKACGFEHVRIVMMRDSVVVEPVAAPAKPLGNPPKSDKAPLVY